MGDNPERLNKTSFAALCGVSPIEYSSGRRTARRLNHGGDQQANAVLHRIVFTRLRQDPRTRATANAAPRRGRPGVRSFDASSDMPPERSSAWSGRRPAPPRHRGVRQWTWCRPGSVGWVSGKGEGLGVLRTKAERKAW
ncbi:transposase [Streptomyces sp. NPDC059582]|uniref:transposase n=1 Tax=Streptomyces sp. NPDC059582 TaxID=3346875 RepID=UPI0036BBB618